VRFRYRLDGVDSTWQHADTRREAFYTALRPGHYLFHVTASNEDGIWSEQEAVASFRIRPAYYQTTWFLLLCALAVLALLWSLYVFRLRQLATQMRMRAEARLQERERIARDLHETLMQGTQSVVRGFQVIANELAPNDPVRQRMESSLGHADSVMADSREKLLSLRTVGPARTNLLQQLALVGVQHCPAQGIPFSTKLAGKPRQLVADVFDELYNIGSEAIVNACHHARALSIDVELAYEAARVRLTVRDDGIGIDATTHVTGSRSGHWGLPGMRERALSIGAVLAIESVPGVGTEIVVQVPAALAYGDEQWDTRWRRSWRKAWRRLSRRASR